MASTDILIIGCGVAGATLALRASRDPNVRVTIITKEHDARESATRLAQGGIIGFVSDPDLLVADIMKAGDGLSSIEAAQTLARLGPRLVMEVLVEEAGVVFDRTADGGYALANEAAHSERRVLHRRDTTGDEIESKLLATLQTRQNVTILSDCVAVDVIESDRDAGLCVGAFVLRSDELTTMTAEATVIATGGVGALFHRTTNPPVARGDGIAMASRVGAAIANLEYVQFHPTACALCESESFLISESVRGEGARLLSFDDRHEFMTEYDPEWRDLAPRDVVSRAIYDQMRRTGAPYVWLDIASHMAGADIRNRFPGIDAHCRSHGIDITRDPIPVRPAAHYECGGIVVDGCGRTTIDNLYAVGEASCTGVHGANRLASTSLLEGVVWGYRAAERIVQTLNVPPQTVQPPPHGSRDADEATLESMSNTAREIMWRDVGLIRTPRGLYNAIRELDTLAKISERIFIESRVTSQTITTRNAMLTSLLIARAAAANPVSRGCHYVMSDEAAALSSPYPQRESSIVPMMIG